MFTPRVLLRHNGWPFSGLTKKRLSFREVFTSQSAFFLFVLIVAVARFCRLDYKSSRLGSGEVLRTQQHLPEEPPYHLAEGRVPFGQFPLRQANIADDSVLIDLVNDEFVGYSL